MDELLRDGVFLLNPENDRFASGSARPAPARLTEALIWTLMGALLLLPAAAVPVVLYFWFDVSLVIVAILTVAVSASFGLGVVSARWAWRAWAAALDYRRRGRLLHGRLLRSAADAASELDCLVTIDFTFTDPDGLAVCGRAEQQRPDLAGCLPRRNTPVALLYVSPERYELL